MIRPKYCIKNAVAVCLIFLCSSIQAGTPTYGDVRCEFVRNYDGDTLTVNIPGYPDILGKNIGIRIAGIDTPELRSKDPEVKQMAVQAKNLLNFLCKSAKVIELKNMKRGKYFRIVADVWVDKLSLADLLQIRGLAKPYTGGKKPDWSVSCRPE